MIRTWPTVMLLGMIAIAGAPHRAHAQPPPPPGNTAPAASNVDKRKVARQYVDAGQAAQASHDYDTAITFYRKAYHLLPHPTLIFDIAQCFRLAGQVDHALTLYRRFLTEEPAGPEAQTARELIAQLEATEVARAPKADAPGADALLAEAQPTAAAPPSVVAATHADTGASGAESPGHSMRVYGIASGATGIVAFAIGAGFGLRARSIQSEEEPHGATYNPDTDSRGRRDNHIALAGMIGGGALVVAGAALTWFGFHPGQPAERIAIAPLAAPGIAGLVVAGSLP